MGVPLWIAMDLNPQLADSESHVDGVDHVTPAQAARISRRLGLGPLADHLIAMRPPDHR